MTEIEIFRAANGKPPLHPDDPTIVAVISDVTFPGLALPLLHLDDVSGVADIVQSCARSMDEIDWQWHSLTDRDTDGTTLGRLLRFRR